MSQNEESKQYLETTPRLRSRGSGHSRSEKAFYCESPEKRAPTTPNRGHRRKSRAENVALSGVLGLASLISDRDLEQQTVPSDWFQAYPIAQASSLDSLPTGIPLQGKNLLKASFDVYYQSRSPR
jgi:hypothetical protein